MALAHAILTAVSHRPLSGYDLAKAFRTSTGFFWRASRQQIYGELRRLEEKKLVEGTRHAQERYPDKTAWAITEAGVAALRDWLGTPTKAASIKEELLVKMYALEHADLPSLLRQLAERRTYHDERLTLFKTIETKLAPSADVDLRSAGRLLGARSGVHYEQAMRDWCDEAVARVSVLIAR